MTHNPPETQDLFGDAQQSKVSPLAWLHDFLNKHAPTFPSNRPAKRNHCAIASHTHPLDRAKFLSNFGHAHCDTQLAVSPTVWSDQDKHNLHHELLPERRKIFNTCKCSDATRLSDQQQCNSVPNAEPPLQKKHLLDLCQTQHMT